MKLRKLHPEEHIKTRKLWEEIFTEDTPEFLDYYYSVKAKDNEIYVIEDGHIVEHGPHDELLKDENGAYSKLYKAQFDR